MKRRGFLKTLVSLAVAAPTVGVGASGVVSEAVQRPARRVNPVGVAELERSIEGLYASAADMQPKAFEEWCVVGSNRDEDWPTYRMVPATWRMRGASEAELVAEAWRDMQVAAAGWGDATLYWRKRPSIAPWNDFESNEKAFRLYFRFAILPADWQKRARRGNQLEVLSSWRDRFPREGSVERIA